MQDYKHVVEAFVARNPRFGTRNGSFDRCLDASRGLVQDLTAAGIDGRIVRLAGRKLDAPEVHRSWRALDRSGWVHYVVVVGNTVIDCTARQFDPAMPFPSYVPVAAVAGLWSEAHHLSDLETGEVAGPLRPVFDPVLHEDGGMFYDDGFVHGAVDEFEDSADGSTGLAISEWSSYEPGRGHTVRALEWLRQRYPKIAANGVGTVEVVDGQRVGDIATGYWQHMRSKGLVDVLLDDDGIELDEDSDPVTAPARSPA